ncbi:MAG TPA: prolipoprotein diacylglyceryl transferase family protein [Kofleriaceae bacterium]|nr:prolipoprotein diacylglyceryl transferase family protein [Kofleriaceae bacterium]
MHGAETLGALPYFTLPTIQIGPLDLQPFGILVATGVLLGAWIGRLRGKYLGVDENEIRVLTGYLLVFGFLGAHLFDTLFYGMDRLKEDPILILKVWDGISSYGGFIGGVVGWYVFCVVHKVESKVVIGDLTVWGFVPGFTFGRMGCSVVHDHPGARLAEGSDFFLSVNYPREAMNKTLMAHGGPGPRHDLGFYELCFLLLMLAALLIVTNAGRKRRVGFIVGFLCVLYGPVRFCFEFLRLEENDPRHWGLTFAQWTSIAIFFAGIYAFYWVYSKPAWKPQAVPASESDVDVPAPVISPKKAVGGGKLKPNRRKKKKTS